MPWRTYRRTDPRRYAVHIRVATGRKDAGLLICGLIWTLVGRGVFLDAPVLTPAAPHLAIPPDLRGSAWVASGLLAICASLTPRLRGWAVTVLSIMPTVRVASYLWAWLMYLIPGVPDGDVDGWYRAAVHGAMLALVIYVATERDDTRPQAGATR